MDLRMVRLFVELARRGHFGQTAEALGTSQPRVSRDIERLERRLGTRLLDRTSRAVRLTTAGEALLAHGVALLAAADELDRTARRLRAAELGTVTLGFLRGPAVDHAHALARRAGPDLVVTVRALDGHDVTEAVLSAAVDVAVGPPPPAGSVLCTRTLGTQEARCAVVPAHHPLAERDAVASSDLAGEVALPVAGADHPPVSGTAVRPGARPARTVEDLLGRVAAGEGIAFAPASQASWFRHPGVRYVAVTDLEPTGCTLVWHPDSTAALGSLLRSDRLVPAGAA